MTKSLSVPLRSAIFHGSQQQGVLRNVTQLAIAQFRASTGARPVRNGSQKSANKISRSQQRTFHTARRLQSQSTTTGNELYQIKQEVSFIKPPLAQSYLSSSDDEIDSHIAASSTNQQEMAARMNAIAAKSVRPFRVRILLAECESSMTIENKSGRADDMIHITLQRGLNETDYAPLARQAKQSILQSVRDKFKSTEANGNGNITTKSWPDGQSAMIFQQWLGSEDGRLETSQLNRDAINRISQDREALKALIMSRPSDEIPAQAANMLLWIYGVARFLRVNDVEAVLLQKWRENFDIMPEQPHIHLWALQTLHGNDLKDSPMVSVLIDQTAYSMLWYFDVINNTEQRLTSLDEWMARIPGIAASIFEERGMGELGLNDHLTASMMRLAVNCAASRNDGMCDFVKLDRAVVYEKKLDRDTDMAYGIRQVQKATDIQPGDLAGQKSS